MAGMGKTAIFGVCLVVAIGCAGGTSAISNVEPSSDTTAGSATSDSADEYSDAGTALHPSAATVLGLGSEACSETMAGEQLGLERVPNHSTVFKQAGSECAALPVGSVFRNTGEVPLVVQGIGVSSPDFNIASVDLPRELQPGESITVYFGYRGASLEPVEEALTMATSAGCSEYPIRGYAVADDTVVTRTPTALDFGQVRVGVPSEPKQVLILTQLAEGKAQPKFGGFSSSPEEFVELLEHPTDPITPNNCQQLEVSVRIPAQAEPGPVTGAVFFTMSTEDAEGVVIVDVFASAVE